MRLTDYAKAWVSQSVKAGDIVIDATLGNGHDALFLAQCVGNSGTIYGFDIQESAIQASQEKLTPFTCHKHFFLLSHDKMQHVIPSHIKGKVSAIMFNLGWLPGSDKHIITQAKSTLAALEQSLAYLTIGGKLSVMVYPGHIGGDSEASEVITWLSKVCSQPNSSFSYEKIEHIERPTSPILLKVCKER